MPSNIFFHTLSLSFNLENENQYSDWLNTLCSHENKSIQTLNYVFCTDEELLEYNREYLDHDYYTDIISFPMNNDPIEGDIMISIDRVKDNATTYSVDFTTELKRVMAHGLLHFLGYDDHQEDDIKLMRQKEKEAIELFDSL